ncbi:MAG TPA: hypothetical protein PKK74_02325 [Candidatus Methanoculleus thermohydrogenotrophicum]|jgi:hypothetical protein|nr:hypothetical protein [Candidatus Methanoculleus thermohydrogenotrophicum]NLM82903.1 hypothetical protein [Candidatus Methanoculleus thermohydrogenotrophicum]HOB17520.1 hypothetical protein [Candidatus Methanoculleus thermohydrogenotrophicum]HPZ37675.1 hypothetical protein [Candidatus Methanoculleus thermohydrogenotrophicum]HQC91850.1 hypothetical protein [Candidatus Methanoculleus thermohydrogenotrophicum]
MKEVIPSMPDYVDIRETLKSVNYPFSCQDMILWRGIMLFTGFAIQLLPGDAGETANRLVDESPCKRCPNACIPFPV